MRAERLTSSITFLLNLNQLSADKFALGLGRLNQHLLAYKSALYKYQLLVIKANPCPLVIISFDIDSKVLIRGRGFLRRLKKLAIYQILG